MAAKGMQKCLPGWVSVNCDVHPHFQRIELQPSGTDAGMSLLDKSCEPREDTYTTATVLALQKCQEFRS